MASSLAQSSTRVGRAVWAITLRSFRAEYGDRRLGLFWAFVEPSIYIFVVTVVMGAAHQGRVSPIGGHLVPFVALGVLPYLLFTSIESSVRGGINSNKALLNFPQIKPMDIYIGRTLTELAALSVVFVLLFLLFIGLGLVGAPDEPHRMIVPILLIITCGFSIGIINSIIIVKYRFWANIYQVINRFLFFTSGIFFTATTAPPSVQGFLYYFPIIHATEWLRSAYYSSFESRFMDIEYLTSLALILLLFALMSERVFRDMLISK